MRRFSLILAFLPALGCGPKAPPETAAAPAEPAVTAEMPDTQEARRFAKALLARTIDNWEAVGGDARLVYQVLSFEPDGRWNAVASLQAMDEEMACAESGIWRIADAASATSATMEWDIQKTTCATRDAGGTTRVQVTLMGDGGYKIGFR